MSDATLFVFGLVATLFAIGPLTIAAISEVREKNKKARERQFPEPGARSGT